MNNADILGEVNYIFRDVLDDNSIELSNESTVDHVEGWDSLNHVQIIVAIEKHFNIRFTSAEIQAFKNVGELCTAIEHRLESP